MGTQPPDETRSADLSGGACIWAGKRGAIMWDANQYNKFAAERARPFVDLLAQVQRNPGDTRQIVDLGCGPGTLTRQLAERWPEAHVVGIDNSPEMLAKAEAAGHSRPARFRAG